MNQVWVYNAAIFGADRLIPLGGGVLTPHISLCVMVQAFLSRGTSAVNQGLATRSICPSPMFCDAIRFSLLAEYFDHAKHGADLDPLSYWEGSWDMPPLRSPLPALFGLPSWNDLHAMKRTGMGEDTVAGPPVLV
ncbi:hypothetical protein C8R43DRAFT_1125700 [Mycena crocata]|nr:hypothetical protein C8R43DRAFT_1125700 [Mycena crocata]